MKYVKLFESWLNEEEDGKITKFNKTKPRTWPVAKTRIIDVYQSNGPDKEILSTILGRAKQSKEGEGKFDKDAKIGSLKTLGPLYMKDGRFVTGTSNGTALTGVAMNAIKSFQSQIEGLKLKKDISPDEMVAVVYGLDINGNTASTEPNDFLSDGKCVILLPASSDITTIAFVENITKLPIIALTSNDRKGTFNTTLGNLLLFINGDGDTQSFNEAAGNITDAKSNLGGIFAGEEGENLLAYAKTIKMPGGGSLAVGDENQNGLYKITQGGATKYLGQIKFEFDSDKLTDEAKSVLEDDAVKGALVTADKTIVIVGHADGKGEEEYNLKLSKRRASSVLKYLQSLSWFKKISAKVTTDGVGESQPIAPDKDGTKPTEAALNRRVEFIVDAPADTKGKYDSIKDAAKVK